MLSQLASWKSLLASPEDFFETLDVDLSNKGAMNSISSGPDDGSIDKLATKFWQPMRHDTVHQLRLNLSEPRRDLFPEPPAGQPEVREQNIAGHGNNGYVEVGAGQGFGLEYIGHRNKEHWGWHLALAGRDWDGQLTFWSCYTGAGYGGAKLLFDVAKTTNRPVRARTGLLLIYTQGNRQWVEFERNSVWQQANPSMSGAPSPIDRPSLHPHLLLAQGLTQKGLSPMVAADVESIAIRYRTENDWHFAEYEGEDAATLASLLFYSVPFPRRDGIIPGIVTEQLSIKMKDGSISKARVIAESLLDVEGSDVFFMVSGELRKWIESKGA